MVLWIKDLSPRGNTLEASLMNDMLLEMDDRAHDRIASCAYQIWLREGCPDGRAAEHWKLAEHIIDQATREAAHRVMPFIARRPRRPTPRPALVA
jgi:hypothetical protein